MSDAAFTSSDAIDAVARALVRYGDAETDVIAKAEAALRTVTQCVREEVIARQRDLARADAALDHCRRSDSEDCSKEARAAVRAQERLDRARRAQSEVGSAEARYMLVRIRHAATVQALVDGGRARLGMNAHDLSVFIESQQRAGGTSGPRSGGRSGAGAAAGVLTPVPGAPEGHFLVPLALIDDGTDGVGGPSEFHKGYSPDDLSWGLDGMQSVVLPAVALGKGVDYFRERDAREGRMGTRSYADTYLGFFGDSAVKLEPADDGTFTVTNGRHRIWVARSRGDKAIVARVQ